MPKIKLVWSLILVLGCLGDSLAMRCRQSLVYEGDSKFLVEKKCGEPLAKEIHDEPVPLYNQYGYQYGTTTNIYEVWTYQQSSNDFVYEILFQDGVVKSISANRE